MALIRSSTISSISGSIGGTTFARNRGGAYARNRTVPINPNSTSQTRARSSLGNFSGAWSSGLTSGQRDAWRAFAESQSVLNRLGESITLTGQQAYVRANTLLALAGQAAVAAPPSITPPEITVVEGTVAVYDVSDTEVTMNLDLAVTGRILAFCGPAQAAGASSLKVPFRFFGSEQLTATNAIAITGGAAARVYVAGQRMAWRFVLVAADGGRSNDLLVRGEAVA